MYPFPSRRWDTDNQSPSPAKPDLQLVNEFGIEGAEWLLLMTLE